MNRIREQVEIFYLELWNNHNTDEIATVLHQDFTFHGSLGQERKGHDGFAEYVDMVHKALGDYKCRINDLVVEKPKAFARMTFSGIHTNDFMGFRPTGKRISWTRCALFTFEGEKVSDIWVLGDLKNLEDQLRRNET